MNSITKGLFVSLVAATSIVSAPALAQASDCSSCDSDALIEALKA